MSSSSKLACGLLACALLSEGAVAQSAPVPTLALPAAESAPTPPASPSAGFQSVFSRYRSYRAMERLSWRDINLRVAEIGGWRTYARQANAPEQPQEAAEPGNSASGTIPSSHGDEHAGDEGPRK